MEKVLTISIAAYNVEVYIRQALESCIAPEIMDDIEVLIENDGSKDKTSEIAREYQEKYPQTFRVIDKENGGYGTTVNRSMQEARGKYFKLLDGDDWFNTENLVKLVKVLRESDADWVIARHYKVPEGGTPELNEPVWLKYQGNIRNIEDIKCRFVVGIWQTTVKTAVLREHPFELPAHTLYTDQLFIFYSMPYIKTVQIMKEGVYCYRVGRDGQSVSRENRIKHHMEAVKNVERMLKFYQECPDITDKNRMQIASRLDRFYRLGIRTLLLMPASNSTRKKIMALEKKAKELAPDIYTMAEQKERRRFHWMRKSNYWAYFLIAWKGVENWE